jgi:hypothetical protein
MRTIGIRHRVKRTAEGDASPTQVSILTGDGKDLAYELEDDQAELDWVHRVYPTSFRKIRSDEDPSAFRPHHVKWRRAKSRREASGYPATHLRREGKTVYIAARVPKSFDGVCEGDRIVMALGGSGDRLAIAISYQTDRFGGETSLWRIPPYSLKEVRGDGEKRDDAALLVDLFIRSPNLFHRTWPHDRRAVVVRERQRALVVAMKDRIACEQRLMGLVIGELFCTPEYQEALVEQTFETRKASDPGLLALQAEEKDRDSQLLSALKDFDVYKSIFEPIEGCGSRIAARLIAAILDIRHFQPPGGEKKGMAKLKAFCGVHVLSGGKNLGVPAGKSFPRRRRGATSNWHPDARQALYLLGVQFNRRPDSVWGLKLLEYKRKFREKHPEPVGEKGNRRYTDGHIHRMATWRTLTKFVEWLWREWSRYERERSRAENRGGGTRKAA